MPLPFSERRSPRNAGRVFLGLVLMLSAFLGGMIVGFGEGADASEKYPLVSHLTGKVTGTHTAAPRDVVTDVDFSQFWTVWKDLSAHYYQQPVDERVLFYGALRGMTEAVGDPYTNFFEPTQAEAFSNDLKGEFSGIGAEIGMKDGELQVVAPLPDSPAEKAGIRPRDRILKIDGEDSLNTPVDVAVSKIRGAKGTQVSLELGRMKGEAASGTRPEFDIVNVTITRDVIVVKSVRWEEKEKENGIFVIEIHNFNADTTELFRKAVDDVLEKGARGIIVDVRNDPGGYLDKAIAVAGEWVRDDIVVQQRERGNITERYKGTGRGRLKGIKTVLLVNEGSASASEILAGALQDYGIATIVGKKTFGKGSVQDYLEYEDGSALKVTIAEWLTPNGRSINHEGIKPDVEVELTAEDIHAERDPQLEKAIELLRNGQAKP